MYSLVFILQGIRFHDIISLLKQSTMDHIRASLTMAHYPCIRRARALEKDAMPPRSQETATSRSSRRRKSVDEI